MKYPREFYIPKGAVKVVDKQSDAVAYLYETPCGEPAAVAFVGKRAKPEWRFRFVKEEHRFSRIKELFEGRRARNKLIEQQKAEREAAGRGVEVGDVLKSVWGYEQTNVDYYEVTAMVGKKMVEIRKIGSTGYELGWARGKSAPMPGEYIDEPLRRRASNGQVKIDKGRWAWRMEPTSNVAGVKIYESTNWTAYH